MSERPEPRAVVAFLRDVTQATTRQQQTIDDQTQGDGFAFWCSDEVGYPGRSSPFVARSSETSLTFLQVDRPGPEPLGGAMAAPPSANQLSLTDSPTGSTGPEPSPMRAATVPAGSDRLHSSAPTRPPRPTSRPRSSSRRAPDFDLVRSKSAPRPTRHHSSSTSTETPDFWVSSYHSDDYSTVDDVEESASDGVGMIPGGAEATAHGNDERDLRSDDGVVIVEDNERQRWRAHRRLYDALFSARTPDDSYELVIAYGLLALREDSNTWCRHLAVGPAEVKIDSSTGMLSVVLADAVKPEINWLPGRARARISAQQGALEALIEAQSHQEVEAAVNQFTVLLGAETTLSHPSAEHLNGTIAIGSHPAVLLRKRDSSARLKLLEDLHDDIAAGATVSEPFKMIVDPTYAPIEHGSRFRRPALALPANVHQRDMIDRACTETHMVIQGPPGTGKTHTIANLATVLMAEGRRVLITAETDRALCEVQSKLPRSMQPLMLPMLKERGSGALEASVNELNNRASANLSARDREAEIRRAEERLADIETQIERTQAQLVQLVNADSVERIHNGRSLQIGGHQLVLAAECEKLELVDRYLSVNGRADADDAHHYPALFEQRSRYDGLDQYHFPAELIDQSDLAVWLADHRRQLTILGDRGTFDHSVLAERVPELQQLILQLRDLPSASWRDITRTAEDYCNGAADCARVASAIDHSITLEGTRDPSSVVATLNEYLKLDGERFDQPIGSLVEQYRSARAHCHSTAVSARLFDSRHGQQVFDLCQPALDLIDTDRSGLLETYLAHHQAQRWSPIDSLIDDALKLGSSARPPLGPAVTATDPTLTSHALARQAANLFAYLNGGGRFTKMIGTPAPVRDAQGLLNTVLVGGAPIATIEDVETALNFFRYHATVSQVDAWAYQNSLVRPPGVNHHEWLKAICELPATAPRVLAALAVVGEVVEFGVDATSTDYKTKLQAAMTAAATEVMASLGGLVEAAENQVGELRVGGRPVSDRQDAQRGLKAFQAAEIRCYYYRLLPQSWQKTCDLWATGPDRLVDLLTICAAAAKIPGEARRSQLAPSTVNEIIELARIDQRRRELEHEYEAFIGAQLKALDGCVPKSPATCAVKRALESENVEAYRLAVEELDRERAIAEAAIRFSATDQRLAQAHPALINAMKAGDSEACRAMESLSELEDLRDYRSTVIGWLAEVGSSEPVHQRLSELDKQRRKAESNLASLRCWSMAIERLQADRSLRSSLSALTIAMDKVPKTKTAKSYPSRVRALRSATRAAAPAIPCWVMTIDRLAEVIGYPEPDQRFDVIIVDEASQAWFPSIFLYALADQVIVVGDDLQTSPSGGFKDEEIRTIARENLGSHRLADQVGGDLSLYDVAAIMTGPDTMIDHFRCVPEIIDLSNRLSYGPKGKRLLPCRVRENNSLDPVVRVPINSLRVGKGGANRGEASAVVERIAQCHADPRYENKTFGVVVVGTSPASHIKHILTLLLEKVGPSAIADRQIEVGTASQFQGAERDVMFMSMLDSAGPGERLRAWPHEHTGANKRNVQKLNVAVSRARDQLWIFHSFGLDALAPQDVRTVLFNTVQSESSLEDQLDKCDSKFEKDVVRALIAADPSLMVTTQVEAIGYSIDIVIESPCGARLAVECDGDRWHSSDPQVRADLYRQRTLENIGWRFDRFLASEWYHDPSGRTARTIAKLFGADDDGPVPSIPPARPLAAASPSVSHSG